MITPLDKQAPETAVSKLQKRRLLEGLKPRAAEVLRKNPRATPAEWNTAWAFDELEFVGTSTPERLHDLIIDGSMERSIDTASVLEIKVSDPNRVLANTAIWQRGTLVDLNTAEFAQVRSEKQGNDYTIDFEDRIVNVLKRPPADNHVDMAFRDTMTRAQFILWGLQQAAREANISFHYWIPELTRKQPTGGPPPTTSSTSSSSSSSAGFRSGFHPAIKGAAASAEQLSVLTTCLGVATQLGAPRLAMLAMVEVLIQENDCTNRAGGGGGSNGAFQVIPSTAAQAGISPLDLVACAKSFLTNAYGAGSGAIALAKANPSWSPDAVGQAVQRSGAGAGAYAQWASEATAIVNAWSGGGVGSSSTVTQVERYAFQRKSGESWWDCFQRLAKEVNWRFFVTNDICCYVSDDDILALQPRMVISEGSSGVDWIDWVIDESKKIVDTITITADILFWEAPPSTVVVVHDSGAADGEWIITDTKRGAYDKKATITAVLPTTPLPEPAAQNKPSSPRSSSGGSSSGPTSNSIVNAAWNAAQKIIAKHYPYVWGGGHVSSGSPSGGGYDCSGFISAIAHAAGVLGSQPLTSTGFESWGDPGKGSIWTVWANAGHVWSEFHLPNGSRFYIGTTHAAPGGGPGQTVYPGDGYAAAFVPRHWPGC